MEARRALMVKLICDAMGKELVATSEAVPEDDDDDDGIVHIPDNQPDDERDDELDEVDDEGDDLDAIKREQVQTVLIPALEQLQLPCRVRKSGKGVTWKLGPYRLSIGARRAGRFTLYIYSNERSREQALADFPGAEPFHGRDPERESRNLGMMGKRTISDVERAIQAYQQRVRSASTA